MALKDMAMTADEAKETLLSPEKTDVGEAPKYPYGLSLDLGGMTLEKLGVTNLPAVGSEVQITAVARVTRVSAYDEQDGIEQCVGLQITSMEMNTNGAGTSSAAQKLYRSDD